MTKTAVSYQLWIALRRPLQIEIGRLGLLSFPAGVYVYTGSAKRNLEARIARHCRRGAVAMILAAVRPGGRREESRRKE